MSERKRQNRERAALSLNMILWLVFSVFALGVILVCVLLQNVLFGRNYRQSALETLQAAEEKIAAALSGSGTAEETRAAATALASEAGVNAYLLYLYGDSGYVYGGGKVVTVYGAERTYQELAKICHLLEGGDTEEFFLGDEEIACVSSVTYGGQPAWLCLFFTLAPLAEFEATFRLISVITGLVAIVLAFAASGLVSRIVTKPVAEVTDRAKELARGNYGLDLKEDYFCSEMRELSSALEYARTEISRADRLQRELIANVSHDFKTPLTMIKAYASMIREITGENKEKRDADAQIIIDEADRLTALVSDVLDLSKLRAGVEEERTVFDLSAETLAIVERFRYLEETQGYRIETAVEEGITVRAAQARVGQVVYNLVGNAVNYAGDEKRVRVKLFRKEGASRLEVIDSGKGIPPEEAETIWDRYYRSEQTHKRPVQGTGLGLSIVKSVLLSHGFAFGVVSEPGKGSCFWVEFPPPAEDEEEAREKPARRKKDKA